MRISPLLLSLVVLAGCAGNSLDIPTGPNPLAGNYTGTYESTDFEDSGTANVNITSEGVVSGTVASASELSGVLSGNVTLGGFFTGRVQFSGQPEGTLRGPLTLEENGDVTGPISETINGRTGVVRFALRPVVNE